MRNGNQSESKPRNPQAPSRTDDLAETKPIETTESREFLRGILSAFLLFHIVAIVCWAFPFQVAPIADIKNFERPYMAWSGLFQSWDFFAPNPKRTNSFVEADVLTQSHRQIVWAFPRMEQLGYFDRYREERYRKFIEILPLQINAPLWPNVAAHIARLVGNPSDPPEAVVLIEFAGAISPGDVAPPKPKIFYEYFDNIPTEDNY